MTSSQKKTFGILLAIVAILAVGIGIYLNANKTATPTMKNSGGFTLSADKSSSAQIYIDPACPDCKNFIETNKDTLDQRKKDGKEININVIAHLDHKTVDQIGYPTHASNAIYCVASTDESLWWDYLKKLYAVQPQEGTDPGTSWLIEQAHAVGATKADDCITSGKYNAYVTEITQKAHSNGINWVPTVNSTQYQGIDKLPEVM